MPRFLASVTSGVSKNPPLGSTARSLINPYSPPDSTSDAGTLQSPVALRTKIGLVVGAAILVAAIAFLLRIAYVYIRYPGLIDPPAGPVSYWPELDVLVGSVFAGLLAVTGTPTLWLSFWSYRKQRSSNA